MRIRATVAAASGALALSALTVPAAQAADAHHPSHDDLARMLGTAHGATPFTATPGKDAEPYRLDLSFSKVKVNHGKPVVAGAAKVVEVSVTFTVTHSADIDLTADDTYLDVQLYRGRTYETADNELTGSAEGPSCKTVSATKADCTATIEVDPYYALENEDATTWKLAGSAVAFNGQDETSPDPAKVGYVLYENLATTKLQRSSKLTADASPEPVKKDKTLTVTGKLTRANWDHHDYRDYADQAVNLQFRKKGSTTYATLKTIKASSTGTLKTTVKATADGYYRYSFTGTSTTPAVNATGDYVDVK
ncbi:hypothetical protein [Streptomyces collinus]|uniref:hypothetical protein n=1 Tax=Streptomyces collinus TaxID=42684 RepID=UPI00331DC0B8